MNVFFVFFWMYGFAVVIAIICSACRAINTDIPDPHSPPLITVHCLRQVLGAIIPILRELLDVGLSWSPAFAWPCEGVHRSTSLTSSSLLLQQCPACLVCLTLKVFVMGGRWQYRCCFLGCCLQVLFKIALSILVQLPLSFFYIRLVSVQVVHPYSSIDTIGAWKKLHFILSFRSNFHMTDSLLIAIHAFVSHVSMSVLVDAVELWLVLEYLI